MQFRDLKAQYLALKPEIDSAIQAVIDSSQFILGSPVAELEQKLAEYTARKHCITCASGTDALQLSLMAMDIGRGDIVFTSDFTYFASAAAASILGADVIPVDIDYDTFNISPQALDEAIHKTISNIRNVPPRIAIIPVDLFGLPADYTQILPIAKKYGAKVIEDGAQGFGGRIGQTSACSFGHISATSFFPAKPLGCYGDGGAVFVDDDSLAERIKSLRQLGKAPNDKYDNCEIGINSRLDTIQAAILLKKLKAFSEYELDDINRIAGLYDQKLIGSVKTPYIPEGFYSSRAQYTIKLENQAIRDRIMNSLSADGIPSMIYYPRGIHRQKAYEYKKLPDEWYPNTIRACSTVLSLPIHPYMSEESVDRIAAIIRNNV